MKCYYREIFWNILLIRNILLILLVQQTIQITFQSCFMVHEVKHPPPKPKKLTGFFCPGVNDLNWHGKIVGEVIGAWRCRFLCIDSVFCFLLGRAHHVFLWGQRRKMERLFILTCNVMPPTKDVDKNVSSYPNSVCTLMSNQRTTRQCSGEYFK